MMLLLLEDILIAITVKMLWMVKWRRNRWFGGGL
jgi:hypothetical protein